ncbi:MAG: UDP-glucose 6-dehydrogenase, partial [uncultured Thermomicrobiales bacterium]
ERHHLRHRLRRPRHRRLPRRRRQPRALRRRRPDEDRPPQPRRDPDLRAGSPGGGGPERPRRPPRLHHRRPRRGRARDRPDDRRRHPGGRGRAGRPLGGARRRDYDRRAHGRREGPRHQVDRAGRHGRSPAGRGRRPPRGSGPGTSLRRGLQPRVPQGGGRPGGLRAAGPDHRRGRGAPLDRAAAPALRPIQPQPRPAAGDGRPLGRADQVRRERHAGDQDLVHERARQPGGAGRRRHRARPGRDRLRPPDRLRIHLPRLRLRRLVLPQGRPGAGAHRRRGGLRGGAAARRRGGQSPPEGRPLRQDPGPLRRRPGRANLRALGSRLQAQHRRHARGAQPAAAGSALGGRRARPRPRPGRDARSRPPLRRAHDRRPGRRSARPGALRRAGGRPGWRRRAGDRDRVAGLPQPRLRGDTRGARLPRHLRRAQRLRPGAGGRRTVHLLRHRTRRDPGRRPGEPPGPEGDGVPRGRPGHAGRRGL